MIIEIILAMVIVSMVLVLNVLYLYFKTNKALLVFQQGAYSAKRMFTYMKENYKYSCGINELCLLIAPIILLFNTSYVALSLFIMFFFGYYNLRFYNLNAKRYDQKLKLKITCRVKRLLITLLLLVILIFGSVIFALYSYGYNFLSLNFYLYLYIAFVLVVYFIFILVILANTINSPIEMMVRNHYKKLAKNKLAKILNLEVIGITGSFGKTSTKNIVGSILAKKQPTLISPASYNTPMGLTMTIDKELSNLYRYFVAEMGAYKPGEIRELVNLVKPKYGIVTSVGHQHLETFKSIENVTKTKMELIEGLPTNGLGIINYDNEYIRNYQIKNDVKVLTYSLQDDSCDIYGFDIKYQEQGMEFKFKLHNLIYSCSTKLLGRHNVENIMAAILLADHLGYSIDDITSAIKRLAPVKNRLELKRVNNKTIMIDDAFNANEVGIKESIYILGQYQGKKRILITPGLIDLGSISKKIHHDLGMYLTKYVDQVMIVGDYNYQDIIDGIEQTDFDLKRVKKYDNFLEAYRNAISIDEDKVILVANDLPDKFNN